MNPRKLFYGLYAVMAYVVGMAALLYLMGFVIGVPLPKTIDHGAAAPLPAHWLTNLAIVLAFLVPHSIMARPRFKQWWTRVVPAEIERSTYILYSGITTLLMLWAWQPMPAPLWHIENEMARLPLYATYALGWLVIVLATFNIDHLAFFGLRQVWDVVLDRTPRPARFTARWLYGLVRHPISAGWLVVFWATPTMTSGHLLFAGLMTLYIALATPMEEHDLIAELGNDYLQYKREVPAFVPWRRQSRRAPVGVERPT